MADSMLKMIIFNVPGLPHERLPATCSHMEQIISDKTRTAYAIAVEHSALQGPLLSAKYHIVEQVPLQAPADQ